MALFVVRHQHTPRGMSRAGSLHGRRSPESLEPPERPATQRRDPRRGGGARRAYALPDRGSRRGAPLARLSSALSDGRQRRCLSRLDLRARGGQRRMRRGDAGERPRRRGRSRRSLPASNRGGSRRSPRPSAQLRDGDPGTARRRGHAERSFLRPQPLPDPLARCRVVPSYGRRPRGAAADARPARSPQHALAHAVSSPSSAPATVARSSIRRSTARSGTSAP